MVTATARALRDDRTLEPPATVASGPAETSGAASGPDQTSERASTEASVTPIIASVALDALPEPVELLVNLRALGAERPASSRSEAPRALALWACEFWAPRLAVLDIGDDVVQAAFESCRREIWLWVTGDRRWSQLSTWLAARVARRATT